MLEQSAEVGKDVLGLSAEVGYGMLEQSAEVGKDMLGLSAEVGKGMLEQRVEEHENWGTNLINDSSGLTKPESPWVWSDEPRDFFLLESSLSSR